jgi:hypothetical protein
MEKDGCSHLTHAWTIGVAWIVPCFQMYADFAADGRYTFLVIEVPDHMLLMFT